MQDNTPIIIGAGQAVEAVPKDLTQGASHADMAGRAANAALRDARIGGEVIDWLACVRTFSDSSPAYACPFGGPDKFPRAVARRIGAEPEQAIYGVIGGQSPQSLVAEAAKALSKGEIRFALVAGGEALANMRAGQRSGAALDWSERNVGDWTDRGWFGGPMIVSRTEVAHGLMDAMPYYGFIETAGRIKAGRSLSAHRDYMAKLIAPMSEVAAQNPYAMFQTAYSAKEISTPSAANRNLVSPYLKNMVAKDGVNQSAAVVLTTTVQARANNIPESQWVYLRGHAEAQENLMLDRMDLSRSLAMDLVIQAALKAANVPPAAIDHADIYSCFPCVVDQAATQLDRNHSSRETGRETGRAKSREKRVTLTGGLPFFGGPGNNYTMHGICETVAACRRAPGTIGLAHGNGGWMSKQAVGIYSAEWKDSDVFADEGQMAKTIAAQPSPGQTPEPKGAAIMESYVVHYKRGEPTGATLIGRLDGGARFYAQLQDIDRRSLMALADGKLDGAALKVVPGLPANKAWLG